MMQEIDSTLLGSIQSELKSTKWDETASRHINSFSVLQWAKYALLMHALREEGPPADEEIEERVNRISLASETWMYYYEIYKAVNEALRETAKWIKNA
jgi:hypothetical protein